MMTLFFSFSKLKYSFSTRNYRNYPIIQIKIESKIIEFRELISIICDTRFKGKLHTKPNGHV
jgi:hypothetical protein